MKNYRNKDWLRKKYWDEGMNLREIGDECGVSGNPILKWMKKFNIPRRTKSEALKGKHHSKEIKKKISEALKGRSYHTEESKKKISEFHKGKIVSAEIRKKISENHVGMLGKNHSEESKKKIGEASYKGDKAKDISTYRTRARRIWEEYYGVKIPKGMVIHHMDFNPRNNEIWNLQLLSKKAHRRIHGQYERFMNFTIKKQVKEKKDEEKKNEREIS